MSERPTPPREGPEVTAASLLARVSGDADWEREQALAQVRTLAPADVAVLLPALEEALRDPEGAERRNAARSVLAALAAPAGSAEALGALQRLAADPDTDVRVLSASALGESGNPAACSALETALDDSDPNVAAAAADALGVLGDPRALPALITALRAEDPWRAIAAAVALGRLRDARALPALSTAVTRPWVGSAAAQAIGEIGDARGVEALRPAVESGDPDVRAAALEAVSLVLAGVSELPEWLRDAARASEADFVRRFAADADAGAARLLGASGSPAAVQVLLRELEDPERRVAAEAGLRLLPPETALRALLPRLADTGVPCALLLLLPPLPDAEAAERVIPFLASGDEEVRGAAADALAHAAEAATLRSRLLSAMEDPALRAGAVLALGRLPGGACTELVELLGDPDPRVRASAAEGVARCPAPEVEPRIGGALEREADLEVRRALITALGSLGGEAAAARLSLVAADAGADPAMRFAAVKALGRSGASAALAPLLGVLATGDTPLRVAALEALGELGDARGGEALARSMDEPEREVRRAAAGALQRVASPAASERLGEALGDPDWQVRLAAARVLGRLGSPAGDDALRRAREADPDPMVREAAARALGEG